MTRIIVTGTTLFCMFFLTGCATIMSHGSQKPFLGGIIGMLIVDPLTGSMWRFEEKDVSVKLYTDTPEGRAVRPADEQARTEAKEKEQAQREKQLQPR